MVIQTESQMEFMECVFPKMRWQTCWRRPSMDKMVSEGQSWLSEPCSTCQHQQTGRQFNHSYVLTL